MRFQEHGENFKKMTLERATTPKMSSPCHSTTNSMAISLYKRSDSHSSRSSFRTLTHSKGMIAPWCDSSGGCLASNMRSLMAVLPKSPSPICSDCSSPRDSTTCSTLSQTSNSQVPTSSCIVSFDSPTSRKDIDGWMENAKSCCWVRQPYLLNNQFKALDQELSSPTLPSTEELSYQAYADSMHGARSQNDGQHKLLSQVEPHHALFDEVKRRELEADIDAWKKAKFLELVDELERKEAAISIWEFEKTKKAMEELEKLESKLERKRLREIEKTQKKIGRVNKEANKKKSKARRSTIEEISAVSAITEKIRATKSFLLLVLKKFC
ncbi:hypothetical protein I3760_14G026900 [Carya illinoinensis]|nr:hypothetical protein I3760_14G026900 [Carya illinoinensis]